MSLTTFFKSPLFFFLIAIAMLGCGGTHGGIINYCYNVNHQILDSAIKEVLRDNKNIQRNSTDNDGYNRGDYFHLQVIKPNGTYSYNFRYYGDSSMWHQDSLNACMFIWAMYDPKKQGGWDRDFGLFNNRLKKELLKIIEVELILKIDSTIGTQHTIE